MYKLIRLALLPISAMAGLFILEGCSSMAPPPSAEAHLQQPYHERIAVSGRFSASYQHQGRPENVQGRFQWHQRGDDIDIDLLSPLGQTLARIRVAPGLALLERPGQQTQSAINASELTEQMLGWAIPADGLRYWLQGFSRAGSAVRRVDLQTVDALMTEGWQVRFYSWQTSQHSSHPKRIDLAHSSSTAGDLALRLVIDSWEPR